jgi:hypothetical protein
MHCSGDQANGTISGVTLHLDTQPGLSGRLAWDAARSSYTGTVAQQVGSADVSHSSPMLLSVRSTDRATSTKDFVGQLVWSQPGIVATIDIAAFGGGTSDSTCTVRGTATVTQNTP